MTTDITEFPCIEATRCLIAETEMGKRLSVKAQSDGAENSHTAIFTPDQSPKEEWYLHLDIVRDGEENPPLRFLQLRHKETGKYLSCDAKGRITCTSSPSESTWWLMQSVVPNETDESNDTSPKKSASEKSLDDKYILVSKEHPLRRLSYAKTFEGAEEEFTLIGSKNASTEPSIWTLTITSGELCCIVNPVVHHHMRCNPSGNLSLTSQNKGYEVFRFIEAGNGDLYISSWLNFRKFLSSNSDGEVYTTDMDFKSLGFSERWRVDSPPRGNGVYIRNLATRRFLSVGRKRSEPLWTTTKPNEYALWHLDAPQSHVYYLTSLFASSKKVEEQWQIQSYFEEGTMDTHISSSKKGPYLSQKNESKEEWKIEVSPEGYFTFFSISHEKYLGCNSKGDVHTTTSKGSWTFWEKQDSPHGGLAFKSKEHKRFLAVTNTDHALCTMLEDEETTLCQSWRLDPCVPRAVSGDTGGFFLAGMCNIFHVIWQPLVALF